MSDTPGGTAPPPPPYAPPQLPFAPPQPPRPPLRRSKSNRKVAGVCGGLARWLDIDPLLLRVVLVVLTVFGGSGVLLYGLAWLLLPEEGTSESEAQRLLRGRASVPAIVSIVVVIVGISVFGSVLGHGNDSGLWVLLVLLGVGLLIAMQQGRIQRPDWLGGPIAAPLPGGAGEPEPPPPPAATPKVDPFGRSAGTAYSASAGPGYAGSGYPGPAYAGPPPGTYPGQYGPPAGPYPYPPGAAVPYGPPPPPRVPRERSALGALTLSVALVAGGIVAAWGLWQRDDAHGHLVAATVLAVIGAGLVVGAVVGRARGLIAAGVVASLVVVATATYDVPLRGGAGERFWTPMTLSALEDPFRLGAGSATLDLTEVDLNRRTVAVEASVAAGELIVLIPDDADVRVDARAGLGEVDMPDLLETSGISADRTWFRDAAGTSTGTLTLDLEVGMGLVEVRRAAS